MTVLPPYLMTSERGSFARETIEVRKAKTIAAAMSDHEYPPDTCAALRDFAAEIVDGRPIAPLPYAVPLQADWEAALARWRGRGWLEVPWYFAEAYFYVRLLATIGYFAGRAADPFAKRKQALLAQTAAILPSLAKADALAESLPRSEAWALLVRRSLWGNRLDLSNEAILERHANDATHMEDSALLVDDTARALHAIDAAPKPVHFLCDNSGPEFVSDLHLADWLLRHATDVVTMELKAQPFFVSDTMVADAHASIAFLTSQGDPVISSLGARLSDAVARGALRLRDHPFWTGPGFYTQLPPDIVADFSAASLVIAKGDVNYRRFLEDRHWPFHTPIEQAVRRFPTDALLLRTFKGELAAGLPQAAVRKAAAEGDDWLIAGRHGVAQLVPGPARLASQAAGRTPHCCRSCNTSEAASATAASTGGDRPTPVATTAGSTPTTARRSGVQPRSLAIASTLGRPRPCAEDALDSQDVAARPSSTVTVPGRSPAARASTTMR